MDSVKKRMAIRPSPLNDRHKRGEGQNWLTHYLVITFSGTGMYSST